MNFEEKLKELELLVERLEDKNLKLDEGIALFENGLTLTKECLSSLSESKGKIAVMIEQMDKLVAKP